MGNISKNIGLIAKIIIALIWVNYTMSLIVSFFTSIIHSPDVVFKLISGWVLFVVTIFTVTVLYFMLRKKKKKVVSCYNPEQYIYKRPSPLADVGRLFLKPVSIFLLIISGIFLFSNFGSKKNY